MSCTAEPVATVSLRYADRQIVWASSGPNEIHVCSICAPEHLAAMTPPVGWLVDDARLADLAPRPATD